MAIQLLPGQSRTAGLGQSMGTGLGQGLQFLLQDKMNRMTQAKQQKQAATGLEALGIPQKEAANLSMLPKELLGPVVKNYLAGAETAGIEQALAGIRGEEAPAETGMQALMGVPAEAPAVGVPAISEVEGVPSVVQQALRRPRVSPEQQIKLEKLRQQQEQFKEKVSIAEQKHIDKETLPFYKDVLKDYKATKENERRLGRMEELVRKGKLDSPVASSLLDRASKGIFGFGLNLDALRSPDSQEFKKLSVEFLKGAKAIFGARVTSTEMEMFLKMIPTLNLSDQGKLRVISNMQAYSKAELLKKNAMDELIKQNRGKRPGNLASLVETAIEPELDRLAQVFKRGYNIQAEPAEDKSSFIRRSRAWLSDMPFNL